MGIAAVRPEVDTSAVVQNGVLRLLRSGLSRVRSAPAVLAGVWTLTVLVSLAPTVQVASRIRADLGSSLEADGAASGVNWAWWQEFTERHPDLAPTFSPAIIGFAAVLHNLSDFVDNRPAVLQVSVPAAAYLLGWTFLLGGVLDRFARQRPTRAAGFFAACGVFFFRFLRLGVLAVLVWTFLFGVLHPFLFERVYASLVREVAVERTALLWRLLFYAVFLASVAIVTVLFDYARVRAVVEDRRSMLAALTASARFILRNPSSVAAVFALNLILFAAVLAFYAVAAPPAASGGVGAILLRLLVAQIYVAGRLAVKLTMYASEVALFQDRLAHASYVARPHVAWPDAPVIEALDGEPRSRP